MNKKYPGKIGGAVGAVLLLLTLVAGLAGCAPLVAGQSADADTAPFYTDRVVTVRFVMTEQNWDFLTANAREEEYVRADMWYDGELVPDIALRPKGNSSLSSTISSGSIRYSFKADLNFFNSTRNLDGVKKLNFNNGFSDPTFMREVLSYEIFEQMGLPTPRNAFVDLWINDIHLGLYTMVEQIDKTFLARYFDNTNGNLYKPENQASALNWTEADIAASQTAVETETNSLDVNLGGGNLADILAALDRESVTEEEDAIAGFPQTQPGDIPFGDMPAGNVTRRGMLFGDIQPGDIPFGNIPSGNMTPGEMPFGNIAADNLTIRDNRQGMPNLLPDAAARQRVANAQPGIMGGGARGDYLEQMGLKTNENKADHTALYRFLEVLNNESDETFVEEIEKVLDVDQVLRYIAVSAALVHLDNYLGMGHNYYLYEVDGKFTIIPWDLNMSFGNYNSGLDRDGIINFLIDEPTTGILMDRPLVARLLAVPAYLETYHGYLEELINGPFSYDVINARIDEIADLIRPYVQADTLKFFSDEAFETLTSEDGVDRERVSGNRIGLDIGLKAFVVERIASIEKQLAGELPSTNNGQGNGGNAMGGGMNAAGRGNPGQP